MSLKLGELFSGYGGLGAGVAQVLDVELAWYADVCKFDKAGNASHHEPHRAPCSIMGHHYPDVPNLGDVSAVDWSQVEPVDVLTGGSPCQDLSHAGRRAGMTEGTRSNLWVAMREAIAQLRPSIVVWENVRGAYSAEADSELESNPRLLADTRRRDGEPVLRALGRVLGDLSDLGYDAQWHGLRAADVGAPHGRFRVFVVAYPVDDRRGAFRPGMHPEPEHPATRCDLALLPSPRTSDTNGAGQHGDGGLDLRTTVARMLPTPTTRDHKDHTIRREPHRPDDVDTLARALTDVPCALLPTPNAGDAKQGYVTTEAHKARAAAKKGANPKLGDLHEDLPYVAQTRLLPTPVAGDALGARNSTAYRSKEPPTGVHIGDTLTDIAWKKEGHHDPRMPQRTLQWGDYAAAIARWEHVLGRPAPAPTQTSAKGNPQLSAAFVEWLMGLPAGWVTDVPGITRNEALRTMLAWEAVA